MMRIFRLEAQYGGWEESGGGKAGLDGLLVWISIATVVTVMF